VATAVADVEAREPGPVVILMTTSTSR
jgi:hypothetical protein